MPPAHSLGSGRDGGLGLFDFYENAVFDHGFGKFLDGFTIFIKGSVAGYAGEVLGCSHCIAQAFASHVGIGFGNSGQHDVDRIISLCRKLPGSVVVGFLPLCDEFLDIGILAGWQEGSRQFEAIRCITGKLDQLVVIGRRGGIDRNVRIELGNLFQELGAIFIKKPV